MSLKCSELSFSAFPSVIQILVQVSVCELVSSGIGTFSCPEAQVSFLIGSPETSKVCDPQFFWFSFWIHFGVFFYVWSHTKSIHPLGQGHSPGLMNLYLTFLWIVDHNNDILVLMTDYFVWPIPTLGSESLRIFPCSS